MYHLGITTSLAAAKGNPDSGTWLTMLPHKLALHTAMAQVLAPTSEIHRKWRWSTWPQAHRDGIQQATPSSASYLSSGIPAKVRLTGCEVYNQKRFQQVTIETHCNQDRQKST